MDQESASDPELLRAINETGEVIGRVSSLGVTQFLDARGIPVASFAEDVAVIQGVVSQLLALIPLTENYVHREILSLLQEAQPPFQMISTFDRANNSQIVEATGRARSQVESLLLHTASGSKTPFVLRARNLVAYERLSRETPDQSRLRIAESITSHKTIADLEVQAHKIIKRLGDVPANVAALNHATRFGVAGRNAFIVSWVFLVFGLGLVGGVAFLVREHMVGGVPTSTDPSIWVPMLVSRVVFYSLLSSAAVLCFRSYRANQHIAVSNKHRARVLNTFTYFLASTTDESIKSALLRAAADTIFQQGTTGFLGDAEAADATQLVGLVREVVSSKAAGVVK